VIRRTVARVGASDLLLAGALLAAAVPGLLIDGVPWGIRWVLGVILLVLLPGYSLVAALFPGRPASASRRAAGRRADSPNWAVRAALAVATSAVVVALVGVGLSATVGIRLVPAVIAVAAVTGVSLIVAAIRRARLAPRQRATPLGPRRAGEPDRSFPLSGFQSMTLVLGVLVLGGALIQVAASPNAGQSYSEMAVLTPGPNGSLVADGFPETVATGEAVPVHVRLENHEGGARTYGVLVTAATVTADGDVREQAVLDRFRLELADGERSTVERQVEPTVAGDAVRIRVLAYLGGAPDSPDARQPDLSTRFWTNVTDG
jgi:uncharacterized membrane protein